MYRYYLYHPFLRQPARLKTDPVGWDTLNKTFSRNRKSHGMFFKYTPKLKFVKDGRAIIHTLNEKFGSQTEIIILIDVFDPVSRRFVRDYTGRLNLMRLVISTLYAECNIENTGFIQKFENGSDVKVNYQSHVSQGGKALPSFANESMTIDMHPSIIRKTFKSNNVITDFPYDPYDPQQQYNTGYKVSFNQRWYKSLTDDNVDNTPDSSPGDWELFVPLTEYEFDLSETVLYFIPNLDPYLSDEIEVMEDYPTQIDTLDPVQFKKYRFKVKNKGAYKINVDLKYRMTLSSSASPFNAVAWFLVTGKPGNYETTQIGTTDISEYTEQQKTIEKTVNLNSFDEIYFYARIIINEEEPTTIFFNASFDHTPLLFQVTADTTYPKTQAEVVLVHEAFSRVVSSITDVPDSFRSDYYGRTDSSPHVYDQDGEGSLRAILGGFHVRGWTMSEKALNMSFKDLIDTFSAVDGVGVGIEVINGKEYVVVNPLSYFYRDTEILRLDNVLDITKENAEEYYYNEGEFGYKSWSNEKVGNLDESNSKREYTFPITQTKNKLTLISPYLASGLLLEDTRRDNVKVSRTKDNKNDQENFLVQLRRSEGSLFTDKDEDFDAIDNVINKETRYNTKLAPGRCIRRNGQMIRSFLDKYQDQVMRLNYSEGNSAMVSKLATESVAINEGANILISTLAKPLWIAEIYRFKAKLTHAQIVAMNTTPYGYVSFSGSTTNHKKAFILDAEKDAQSNLVSFITLKANL